MHILSTCCVPQPADTQNVTKLLACHAYAVRMSTWNTPLPKHDCRSFPVGALCKASQAMLHLWRRNVLWVNQATIAGKP